MSLPRAALLTAAAWAFAAPPALAEGLKVAYPADGHRTTAERIFLIGTAAPGGDVTVAGRPVRRSPGGHFAPSVPLQPGPNRIVLSHRGEQLVLTVHRRAELPPPPLGATFAAGSLEPAVDRSVQPGELVRFCAVAEPGASVSVRIGGRTLPLLPQPPSAALPDQQAGLTGADQPRPLARLRYEALARFPRVGRLGKPVFRVKAGGQTHEEAGPGALEVLNPERPMVVAVKAEAGITRSGPSSDHARLTPLPRGTRAAVTGREGAWLRLAHGPWIERSEVVALPGATPPRSAIRSVRVRPVAGATELVFPLQEPVPATVDVEDGRLTLTLHHVSAQTDLFRTPEDAIVRRLDWVPLGGERIAYRVGLHTRLPWGWSLRYEGTSLVLVLRHPPPAPAAPGRLDGLLVALDPGHGGTQDHGTHGPTGRAEKDVTLPMTLALREALERRGARCELTRTRDAFVDLKPRTDAIARIAPHLSLSLHYNALPDAGDAEGTRGFGAFWYHPQAHGLAAAIHRAMTRQLGRPSYGVWWDNLALARPTVAPAVLLELGFLINPEEYEWCVDPASQRAAAEAIADGVASWLAAPRD
ncbi:MAG: N-acetylmuramoyl-L-alanine amidase [Candidatus Sericytochromatia bacterium]|nr:N-acetylmuramoyl-L-alanine amidase [Candidatus Sericytochromatia bacterium]